jgi:hypothetical protein
VAFPTSASADTSSGSTSACSSGINGVTGYLPGYGGIEGKDVDARGNQPYTVQDYLNCQARGSAVCGQITVATSQASGIPLGTVATWPALVQDYNQKYGLNLPSNTQFVVNDHYGAGWGNGTFDVAMCATHDATCFTSTNGTQGSFSNLGNPLCPGQTSSSSGSSGSSSSVSSALGTLSQIASGLLFNFGGIVSTPPIICTTPPKGIYTVIIGPSPLPIIFVPKVSTAYEYGPPFILSQNTLGQAQPAGPIPCIVGTVPVGAGYIIAQDGTGLVSGVDINSALNSLLEGASGTPVSGASTAGSSAYNAKAAELITKNARSGYHGGCASSVMDAVQQAGQDTGTPVSSCRANLASQEGPCLTQDGYAPVAGNSSLGSYTPQAGDVAIFDALNPYQQGCGGHSCGHAEMYNGTNWVSDTIQIPGVNATGPNGIYASSAYVGTPVTIYRHGG